MSAAGKTAEILDMRKRFAEKAGVGDILDKSAHSFC